MQSQKDPQIAMISDRVSLLSERSSGILRQEVSSSSVIGQYTINTTASIRLQARHLPNHKPDRLSDRTGHSVQKEMLPDS